MRLIRPCLTRRVGISSRCAVSSLRVSSGPLSLPTAMLESGSGPADSMLQPFTSFLDVSQSFAGRKRDECCKESAPVLIGWGRFSEGPLRSTALGSSQREVVRLGQSGGARRREGIRSQRLADTRVQWTIEDVLRRCRVGHREAGGVPRTPVPDVGCSIKGRPGNEPVYG